MNKLKTDNPMFDFLARRPNIVGFALAVPTTLASLEVGHKPLLSLAVAAFTYGGGFLLGADWKKAAKLHLAKSERVEYESIQNNARDLKEQIKPYRKRIPVDIVQQVDEIFERIDEILPQWATLKQFAEQKYTLNRIVSEYLPHVLNTYLNLPSSYYKDSTKARYAAEVSEQLGLLMQALNQVQEAINANAERDLLAQGELLRQKFTDSGNALLKL